MVNVAMRPQADKKQPLRQDGEPAASTCSTTAGHRARSRSTSKLQWLVYLAFALALLALVPRLTGSPRTSALLSHSQWDALPAQYVICSSGRAGRHHRGKRDNVRRSIFTGEDFGQDGYVECLAVANGTITAAGSEEEVVRTACHAQPNAESPQSKPRHPHRKGLPRSNKSAKIERQRSREPSSPAVRSCDIRRLRPGQTLFPGFQDAHTHVDQLGWSRSAVDLVGTKSKEEVVERIERYIRASSDLLGYALSADDGEVRWIEGLGWDQTKWAEPVFPTAKDLSTSFLLRRFAISLRRIDVHALWLSEVALNLVESKARGFPHTPADDKKIEGGLVLRDAEGKPTGVLIDNAMNLAVQVIPKWTLEQRKKYLAAAAERLLESGITAVGDAATDLDAIEFYKQIDKEGALPLRIYSFLACPPDERRCAHRIDRVLPTGGSRFTLRTVKLFADGALGSWGSAMWDDYSDRPGERGLLLIREEEVEPLIRYWMERGWQVGTHAIGDRANTLVLDAYESILAHSDAVGADPRPRVEHAQIMRLSDVPRFGQLGVIASMQPTHCTSDMDYVESRIGPERARGAYPWRVLLDHNATLALGSDVPVELPDPLHGIYSATTRLDPQGDSPSGPGGWYPSQRLSRRQALRGFTLDTSYAQFEEDVAGSIRVGKRADFTILDRDILDEASVSPASLRAAKVDATLIDGRVAFDRVKVEASIAALGASPESLDPARQLARETAEDIVASIVDAWHNPDALQLLLVASLGLIAFLFFFRRGGGSRDAYSHLSALALNTRRPTTEWMNMGFWRDTTDFPTAARQLAELLHASAGVSPGSRILDVGCGLGDSVLLLEQTYRPQVLHAVTYLERDAARAAQRLADLRSREGNDEGAKRTSKSTPRVWCGDITEWLLETSDATDSSAQDGAEAAANGVGEQQQQQYDFILALDCAFHFPSRSDFLRLAYRRLAPGGTVALVDLLSAWPPAASTASKPRAWRWTGSGSLPDPVRPLSTPAKLRHHLTCRLSGVAPSALWSASAYADQLIEAGFAASDIAIEDISEHVFPGFARFLHSLGRDEESMWRGGGTAMLFALRNFGDVVERWGRGGDEGAVRMCTVVARKSATSGGGGGGGGRPASVL